MTTTAATKRRRSAKSTPIAKTKQNPFARLANASPKHQPTPMRAKIKKKAQIVVKVRRAKKAPMTSSNAKQRRRAETRRRSATNRLTAPPTSPFVAKANASLLPMQRLAQKQKNVAQINSAKMANAKIKRSLPHAETKRWMTKKSAISTRVVMPSLPRARKLLASSSST